MVAAATPGRARAESRRGAGRAAGLRGGQRVRGRRLQSRRRAVDARVRNPPGAGAPLQPGQGLRQARRHRSRVRNLSSLRRFGRRRSEAEGEGGGAPASCSKMRGARRRPSARRRAEAASAAADGAAAAAAGAGRAAQARAPPTADEMASSSSATTAARAPARSLRRARARRRRGGVRRRRRRPFGERAAAAVRSVVVAVRRRRGRRGARSRTTAITRAGIADGFYAGAAVAAGVGAYFLYRGFRPEPTAPSVALLPGARRDGRRRSSPRGRSDARVRARRRRLSRVAGRASCSAVLNFHECNVDSDCRAPTDAGGQLYCSDDHMCVGAIPDYLLCAGLGADDATARSPTARWSSAASSAPRVDNNVNDHTFRDAADLAAAGVPRRQGYNIAHVVCDTAGDPDASRARLQRRHRSLRRQDHRRPRHQRRGASAWPTWSRARGVPIVSPSATNPDITGLDDDNLHLAHRRQRQPAGRRCWRRCRCRRRKLDIIFESDNTYASGSKTRSSAPSPRSAALSHGTFPVDSTDRRR